MKIITRHKVLKKVFKCFKCNMCGKDIMNDDKLSTDLYIDDSDYLGFHLSYEFDICDKCLKELFDKFKLSPTITDA